MPCRTFTETLLATNGGECIELRPAKGTALVTPSGPLGRGLCESMRGTPTSGPGYYLTPSRARKCHALFSHGFESVAGGYRRGSGPVMKLSEALRLIQSL